MVEPTVETEEPRMIRVGAFEILAFRCREEDVELVAEVRLFFRSRFEVMELGAEERLFCREWEVDVEGVASGVLLRRECDLALSELIGGRVVVDLGGRLDVDGFAVPILEDTVLLVRA